MSDDPELPEDSGQTVRGTWGLIRDPVFGTFFWGKLVSTSGIWTFSVAAAVLVFDLTGSTLMVGLVGVGLHVPQLLLTPLSGTWADRGHAARQVVAGRLLAAAGAGGLSLFLAVSGQAEGARGAVPVIVASVVVGLGFVVGGAAMQSIVPSLVRPAELPTAMALNTFPLTVARVAGPVVGSVAMATVGYTAAFVIAGASQLAFAVALAAVGLPRRRRSGGDGDFSVRAGLRHVRADPVLWSGLVGIGVVGFASDPAVTLAPAVAAQFAGHGPSVGWLISSFGVGAAVGFVVFSLLRRVVGVPALVSGGLLSMAVGLALLAVFTTGWVALLCFAAVGVGLSLGTTSTSLLIQQRVPDFLRGRVMALWLTCFVGARPVAGILVGAAADFASQGAALALTACVALLGALVCTPRRLGGAPPPATAGVH